MSKKKKVFISVPMGDRSIDDIKYSLEKMHKLAEIIFDQPLEPYDGLIENDMITIVAKNQAVYNLQNALSNMVDVDYYIGIHDAPINSGCYIENMVIRKSLGEDKCTYIDTYDILTPKERKEYCLEDDEDA